MKELSWGGRLCKMDAEAKNEATCMGEGDVAGSERDKLAL